MIGTQPERSGMHGFDAEFIDLPLYFRAIADRTWESRRIGDINRSYNDPCIVETPRGVSTGVNDAVVGTEATLKAFPDRRLLAEDIIISGDDHPGYLSSHRIVSPITNLGDGAFGPATGNKLHARTIADSVWAANDFVPSSAVTDAEKMTIPTAIADAIGAESDALLIQGVAGAVSPTITLITLIVSFQKQIVGGVTPGAVKG